MAGTYVARLDMTEWEHCVVALDEAAGLLPCWQVSSCGLALMLRVPCAGSAPGSCQTASATLSQASASRCAVTSLALPSPH